MDAMRVDKWLWAARFYKTRSLAQTPRATGGKVDVNGQAAKPSRALRAGDRIHLTMGEWRREAGGEGPVGAARPGDGGPHPLRRPLAAAAAAGRPAAEGRRSARPGSAGRPSASGGSTTASAASDGARGGWCGLALGLIP